MALSEFDVNRMACLLLGYPVWMLLDPIVLINPWNRVLDEF